MATLPKNRTGTEEITDQEMREASDEAEEIAEADLAQAKAKTDQETDQESTDQERGIDETIDVLEAMAAIVGHVEKFVDGQIGAFEALRTLAGSVDEAYAAVKDADEIPAEITDLDGEEVSRLADEALSIVNQISGTDDS